MSDLKRKMPILKDRAIKLGIVLGLTLLAGFFIVERARATTGVADNFESYDLGYLTGQGDWLATGFNSFIVNNLHAESGSQSIQSDGNTGNTRTITLDNEGDLSFYFMASSSFSNSAFYLESLGTDDYVYILPTQIWLGDTIGYNPNPTKLLIKQNYSYNVFHRISLNYNISQGWWRARYDFDNWSATTTFVGSSITTLRIESISGSNFFFDSIKEVGECNSTCYECDFEGCQDYGEICYWNYPASTCYPLEGVNTCGEGWLCAFCTEQNTCEAEEGCYWNSADSYCWESEPPVLPEVEDCSEYPTLERITCEIKNFFYRLFVPSSAKITELKTTTDLIKDRFPYNYILATKDFFITLKNDLSNEDIQFGILGVAGVINFDFWNSTTTIGSTGVVQKFLDIFKSISTFIVLFVFLFWAIYFLRKVFK